VDPDEIAECIYA
jgi:hypothetical protein